MDFSIFTFFNFGINFIFILHINKITLDYFTFIYADCRYILNKTFIEHCDDYVTDNNNNNY